MTASRTDGRARRTLPAAALAAAAPLVLAAACSKQATPPPAPALPVTTAVTSVADVPVQWKGVGALEAVSSVEVRARVGGALEKVHFTEGQEVRRGDLLFTIDDRPFAAALAAAEAKLARDQALAENAAADATRYADLAKKEYVTAEDYDARRTNAAALAATVVADRAEVESAKLGLGYCTIRAPLAGRTGSLGVHPGNLVKANDSVLVVIQQIEPIRVRFAVPQQLLPQVRDASRAGTASVEVGRGDRRDRGELSFIDNTVDPGSGTIALKAQLANADHALWPGEFVEVAMTLSTLAGAVVTPSSAIQTGQQGSFVYVVEAGGTVAIRAVEPGPVAGDLTVIRSGLAIGETVVTDGQLRLYPGAKIEVQAP
jgi:multidrug efflux system membrane fusion protein